MQRKPLIIDTDIGGDVDDTWTLGMLFRSDAVELKGITTETGDPLYRAALCAKLVETAGLAPVPESKNAAARANGSAITEFPPHSTSRVLPFR